MRRSLLVQGASICYSMVLGGGMPVPSDVEYASLAYKGYQQRNQQHSFANTLLNVMLHWRQSICRK